jgi:hypothetical protein
MLRLGRLATVRAGLQDDDPGRAAGLRNRSLPSSDPHISVGLASRPKRMLIVNMVGHIVTGLSSPYAVCPGHAKISDRLQLAWIDMPLGKAQAKPLTGDRGGGDLDFFIAHRTGLDSGVQ